MDKKKIVECFEKYELANSEWEKKKQELDDAAKKRSDIVKMISDELSPLKKITFNGQHYTIVARGDTWFFRSPKSATVVIDDNDE